MASAQETRWAMVSNEVRVDLIGADMVGVQNLLMLQRVVLFYVKKVKNDEL